MSIEETIQDIVRREVATIKDELKTELPEIVRKATRKSWLDTNDFEEEFGISKRRQQYLRDSGQIPYVKDGRLIRYKRAEVEKFLKDRHIAAEIQ